MINRTIISGNLTKDPELLKTKNSKDMLRMSLAFSNYFTKDGEKHQASNFIDAVLFGERAKKVQPYLKKGTHLTIDGQLSWSSWTDDQNNKHQKLELIVSDLDFTSTKSK